MVCSVMVSLRIDFLIIIILIFFIIYLGTKTAVGSPKQIQSLNNFNVISISCGAFHTALTASQIGESNFVKIPNRTDLTALHNLLRNQSNEGT